MPSAFGWPLQKMLVGVQFSVGTEMEAYGDHAVAASNQEPSWKPCNHQHDVTIDLIILASAFQDQLRVRTVCAGQCVLDSVCWTVCASSLN